MHFPERRPDPTEERILPLINVVFLLLIFFMLTGSLSMSEPFDIEPPASQSQSAHEPEAVMILMARDGRLALDNTAMPEDRLLEAVAEQIREHPEATITLKADARLPANRLVRFTQALHAAGLEQLRLLTLPEET